LPLVVAAAAVVVAAGIAWFALRPPAQAADPEAAVKALLSGVHVSATVTGSSLAVATAISDTLEDGVHLRRVRIVDELRLDVRIEADRDITFAERPRVCLVWPSSAPDDAGLEDRCWGDPDLSGLMAATLATDEAGRPGLEAHVPIGVAVTLRRGDTRCDYPPGDWHVEMTVNAIVDGAPTGQRDVPYGTLSVPYVAADIRSDLSAKPTRFCGLANGVYQEQGEPPTPKP
jgi:hypothetical protein